MPAFADHYASLLQHANFLAQPSCSPCSPTSTPFADPYPISNAKRSPNTFTQPTSCGSQSYSRSQPLPSAPRNYARMPQRMQSQSQPSYSPSRIQSQDQKARQSQSHLQSQHSPQGLNIESQRFKFKSLQEPTPNDSYTYTYPPFYSPPASASSPSSSSASPASQLSNSSSRGRGMKRTIEQTDNYFDEDEADEISEAEEGGGVEDEGMGEYDEWEEVEPTQLLISHQNTPASFISLSKNDFATSTWPDSILHGSTGLTKARGQRPKGKRWIDVSSDISESDYNNDHDHDQDHHMEEDMIHHTEEDVTHHDQDRYQYNSLGIDFSTNHTNQTEANEGSKKVPIYSQHNDSATQDLDEAHDEDEDFLILDDTSSNEDLPLSSAFTRIVPLPTPYTPRWTEGQILDDEAAEFERLMRRTEAKRQYEAMGNLPSAEGEEAKKQSAIETGYAGKEDALQTDSGTLHAGATVQPQIRDGDGNSAKALLFLEQLFLRFITDIKNSLVDVSQPTKIRSPSDASQKRNQKRRKVSLDANQDKVNDASQEPIQCRSQGGAKRTSGSPTKRRGSSVNVSMVLTNRKTGNDQIISFPDDPLSTASKDPSIVRIACVFVIAVVLYEAIHSRTVVTLRDIFYRDKGLFKRQDVVDKLVDDMVATAGLKRKDFYVCASAKGLIASSSLKIQRRSGGVINLSPSSATLIDPIERIDRLEVNGSQSVDWVLVVEKDAVFQTLCSARLLEDDRLGQGVMVTGKGFPDLATRQMLRLIADTFPNARMYALVDADPHGLSILSTYTYGSKNTAHSHDHHGLALGDRLEWLGVKESDFASLGICYDELLPLEKVDLQLATNMLKDHGNLPVEWRRELCHMLHLNKKAEIEIILSNREPMVSQLIRSGRSADQLSPDCQSQDRASMSSQSRASRVTSSNNGKKKKNGDGGQGRVKNALVEYIVQRICQ
ncbi:hypothetical protein IAT40_006531 [Kwoniella sp. CBS 6097]